MVIKLNFETSLNKFSVDESANNVKVQLLTLKSHVHHVTVISKKLFLKASLV